MRLTVFYFVFTVYCSLSGGADDSHGNQTQLEDALNGANADWEISRYSGVLHGFTDWDAAAYNLNADVRSWESMTTAFHEQMMMPEKIVGDNEKSPSAGVVVCSSLWSWSAMAIAGAIATVFFV
jgi:hypothetical protein